MAPVKYNVPRTALNRFFGLDGLLVAVCISGVSELSNSSHLYSSESAEEDCKEKAGYLGNWSSIGSVMRYKYALRRKKCWSWKFVRVVQLPCWSTHETLPNLKDILSGQHCNSKSSFGLVICARALGDKVSLLICTVTWLPAPTFSLHLYIPASLHLST